MSEEYRSWGEARSRLYKACYEALADRWPVTTDEIIKDYDAIYMRLQEIVTGGHETTRHIIHPISGYQCGYGYWRDEWREFWDLFELEYPVFDYS